MEEISKSMDVVQSTPTVRAVRARYSLDETRMKEAIVTLRDWLMKQPHFRKKDFTNHFLERTLINCKGSVERMKILLDKYCSLKTLMPEFAQVMNVKKEHPDLDNYTMVAMCPKLTKQLHKVVLCKFTGVPRNSKHLLELYKCAVTSGEYLKSVEYFDSMIFIIDMRDINLTDVISKINIFDVRKALAVNNDGFIIRTREMHCISTSPLVDAGLAIAKQVFKKKVYERIHIHKDVESLHQFIDKDLLPAEYGGKQASLIKMNDDWINAISSKEHLEYMRNLHQASTDESLRPVDKYNEDCMGLPGTFRKLYID